MFFVFISVDVRGGVGNQKLKISIQMHHHIHRVEQFFGCRERLHCQQFFELLQLAIVEQKTEIGLADRYADFASENTCRVLAFPIFTVHFLDVGGKFAEFFFREIEIEIAELNVYLITSAATENGSVGGFVENVYHCECGVENCGRRLIIRRPQNKS